jgi:hypothetical protein
MQGVAQQFGTSKTLNEGGSGASVAARGIHRFQGRCGKAYNAIPIATRLPHRRPARRFAPAANGALPEQPEARRGDERTRSSRQYLNALQSGGFVERPEGLPLDHRREDRRVRFSDDPARATFVRSTGLSRTCSAPPPPMDRKAVSAFNAPTASIARPAAYRKALTRILGEGRQMKSPEAAAAIQAMTKGGKGTGDLKPLAQIKFRDGQERRMGRDRLYPDPPGRTAGEERGARVQSANLRQLVCRHG